MDIKYPKLLRVMMKKCAAKRNKKKYMKLMN